MASCGDAKAAPVSWYRYLVALLKVVAHVLLIVFIAWISLSFAHWDLLDEPLREEAEFRILGTIPGFWECWNPRSLSEASPLRPKHSCELYATSLPKSRARSMLAVFTGPWVVGQSVVHWFTGSHFPLTAARSFHLVVTGKEMKYKAPAAVSFSDLMSMIAMASFFFYAGAWVTVLLYLTLHDALSDFERFQTSAQLLVCFAGLLTKLKPSVLFFVIYAFVCCIMACTSSLLLVVLPLALLLTAGLLLVLHRPEYASASRSWVLTVKQIFFDFYVLSFDQD